MNKLLLVSLLVIGGLHAAVTSADSARGALVFDTQGCTQCHALNGIGAQIGPDLGIMADRGFTPAKFAATMWNHAPRMWVEMRLRRVDPQVMDEQQAADLFAFFYSLRFFEEPGDAARGKALFSARRCDTCHGITAAKIEAAKPVNAWAEASTGLDLVETMWNHSTEMRTEMTRRKIGMPQMNGQELTDVLIYTRRASGRTRPPQVFRAASAEKGKALFESKRCDSCHGTMAHFLTQGLGDKTLTDIAADMWNHGLSMKLRKVTFAPGEMRDIADYIWFSRAIQGSGEAGRGAQVFAAKKCSVCHDDPASGAPHLSGFAADGSRFSGATMVASLTRHGAAMQDRMREKNIAWPQFSTEEMSGLIAYLNTRGAGSDRK